jgi:hypothetical protein
MQVGRKPVDTRTTTLAPGSALINRLEVDPAAPDTDDH